MFKEIKYLIFVSIILLFLFLTGRYYFSDINKKNSFRSLTKIDEKINIYVKNLPLLENDTKNVMNCEMTVYIIHLVFTLLKTAE